jgi:putative heme iron utilization protein
MKQSDEHAQSAQWLLASALQGVLSTQSIEHPGYPFGSVIPYVLDASGVPLLLLSHLSQHTKNIDADPHCGLTLLEAGRGDVQKRSRLSAIGDVVRVDAGADADRYFNYFPHARDYHEQLGFLFYRFLPGRFHWNGGFATARWFAANRIVRANPLSREVEAEIVAHMNHDHADALQRYLHRATQAVSEAPVVMCGMDATAIDLRVGEDIYRIALTREIDSAQQARSVLLDMADGL